MSTHVSKITKKYRAFKRLFWSLSFLSNFGLILAFFIYGLIFGEKTTQYSLALVGIVGLVVSGLSVILKQHWRTPLILVLGGLYWAINEFANVLIAVAVCIVLDELIFTPCYKYFANKTMINGEIDRRL